MQQLLPRAAQTASSRPDHIVVPPDRSAPRYAVATSSVLYAPALDTYDAHIWHRRPEHVVVQQVVTTEMAGGAGVSRRRLATVKRRARPLNWRCSSTQGAILLREIEHRAKNNLSLVISLLGREQRTAASEQDERAADRLETLMQRVTAIALTQNYLSSPRGKGRGDVNGMDLAQSLHSLLGCLEVSTGGRVKLEASLESCLLPSSKAIAAGLIVNELVTNAIKHAYPGADEGVVRVVLQTDKESARTTLTVSDLGRGTDPAAVKARQASGGQGLELLRLLAKQLDGDVEWGTPERGTSITVRFPLPNDRPLRQVPLASGGV